MRRRSHVKRASYREAVAWIGDNDSGAGPDAIDETQVSELVTCLLVADLFAVEPKRVARDIIRWRIKNGWKS